ncbi:LOW QUALITY PROTEIN: uncharacterized protein LOC119114923 [Pollicipes pollicipes]|uniref:LOW QUALITY PROTEIN: uncharacterized protein LOC119114923 n=1 Tax=Pollicipes pollicipes TaxID=41117 RepID=UPI001884C305|nr:LOW QUALITY PROTEIN: uncharacterized protein LOC119114923 [Pollicipes pollicipes]
MRRPSALLVAFLAAGALAVPTGQRWENKCAAFCVSPEQTKLAYQPGKTYVYEYSSDTETTLAGATDEASRLHVTATAEITANSGCDFTLQEVTLKDSDPKNANSKQEVDNMATFKRELERRPLSFSYQHGRIEDVCSDPNEPVWVLNFKRGLMSTMVNSLRSMEAGETRSQETDVTGVCTTDYLVEEHGSGYLVTKTKDLLSCTGRGHLISSLQTTPYTTYSKVQSLPLVKSSLRCQQRVSTERLQSAECEESHLFRPFSQGENGAVTRTTVRLTEVTVRDAVPSYDSDEPTVRGSLLFDHADAQLTQRNRVQAAAELLAQLELKTADGVRPEVPALFTRLVRTLRHFDASGLSQLEAMTKDGPARRYFIDALPLAGTASAMSVMGDLMSRRAVPEEAADRWMTALAFVHEPSLEMVAALAPLLGEADVRRQTLLGVSSLVHHYCEQHADCAEQAAVQQAIRQLEAMLGSGCRSNSEDEELKMLTALKALGNAGRLVAGGDTLRSCFEGENTMEVRLAAIRAFRRMPCSAVTDSNLMGIFSSEQEDTEVRIASYLAIMQCPTHGVVDKVQEILSRESVNQVSSFVWSHLTSMQETNDPAKQYMKLLLYNVDLEKKFKTDVRKFSRYFEKTMFSTSMNAGATVDGNVIFTPESYMPKSGMFNFTVDLFGQAINLLEVGGRVEGLEDFSESMFGNNGVYPQQAISHILKTMRGRDSNDLSTYGRRIQTPKASAYLKVFGNELKFSKYDSLNELVSSLGASDPLDFLQKLAKDMDWTENYQFLDSAYTMPTIAGFPFVLKAVGTATVSLKTGGSFNIESWDKMNINGHVKPSAAVEIMSEMVVDAHVAHTGLKMNTNLHTSTVFDGHAIVDSGKMVSVRINMPREKVEILDINTRFHSVFRNKARKLEMHTDNRYELVACSDRYVSPQLLGVNFCTDIRYSQGSEGLPSVLLSGPLTARFTIEKTDTIKGFEFEYRHSNEASVRKSSLVIDTPGSATDRRINVDYMINFEQKAFKAGFRTPIKSMDVSGSLDLAGQTKQFDASLKMDDRELAGVAGRLEVDETPVMVRYSPSFSVRGPAGELVAFDGGLIVSKNKHKYNVDITISKLYQTPIVLKGAFSEDDGTYNVLTSVESYVLDSNMKGSFRFAGDNLIIHANTDYSFMNGERQTIIVSSKMSKDERDDLTAYKLFLDTKFSALPILDTQLTAERQVTSEGCESRLVLTRGERHYELNTMLSHGDKMAASLGVVVAHWDVDFKLGGEMDFSQDHKVVVGIEGRLNKEKFARGKLGLDFKSEQHGFNYGVSADLDLPFAKYSMQTGVRREEEAAHLKMVVVRQTSAARDEVALVALLAREHGQFEVDLTLSVPHYPRWQAAGRLVPGTGGLYLARATLQGGERRYTLGAEYKLQEEHVLELLLEAPGRRFSGLVSALVTGDSPRVKVDLRCDRRVMAVFTALPYGWEKTANFEIFWNKDVDDTQKASFDVLLRGNIMAASLKYPGRLIKLDATLTATELTADLQYAPGKTIHIVRKDQRVGRNGFTTTVNVDTPIEGFTTMSLTLFKKPDVEQDDLLSSDLLVNFEVSGNVEGSEARMTGLVLVDMRRLTTIKTEVDLVTPFRGWEHNQLNFNYHMDRTTFTALASATKNEDQIALGGTFELSHNSDAFKINAGLEVALPTDALRKAKIGFHFKMGDRHLDTGILARWMTTKDMEVSLNFNSKHVLERQTDIDSTLTLKTPFKNAEKFVTNFKFFLDHHRLHTSFSLKDNVREIFLALLEGGSEAAQAYSGKLVINCAVCPGFDVSYDLTPTGEGAKWRIAAHWNAHETSLSGLFAQERQPHGVVGTKTVLTLVLPNPPTTYELRQRHEINVDKTTLKEHLELRRDNEKIIMDMNSKWTQVSSYGKMTSVTIAGHGTLTSPFKGWEYSQISQTVEVNVQNDERVSYVGQTKILKGDKTIEMTDTAKFENALNWQYRREVISNTRWFERLAGSLQLACRSASDATLTGSAEWDGETAELLYSHNIPAIHAMSGLQGHSSDVAISITATWFGGVSKTLKLANRESSEAYHPSLTVNYNVGKTVKLYGALSKAVVSGESHIAFEAPFTEKVTLSVNPTWQTDSIQVVVRYMHGSKSYSADATMTHDFPSARPLSIEGGLVEQGFSRSAHLVLTRNQDQIRAVIDGEFSWTKSAVALEITSPFSVAKSLNFIARYDLRDEQKTFSILLARNGAQIQMNGYGIMKVGAAKGLLQLETPYPEWESVKYAGVYDVNHEEKIMEISYEKNGIKKVIASRGSYNGETAYLDVITPVEGYERMGINGQYISRRGKREAGYDAHVNDHRHRLYVLYERVGKESAKLRIESPIEGMRLVEADIRSQTFPDGVGYYINTNRDGKRNSAEIRAVFGENDVGVDISIKSYVEGLESLQMSGNVVYRGRKRSFSFKSNRGGSEAEVSGEAVIKRRAGNGSIKAKLPIEGMEDVDVSFDYKLGKKKSFRLTSIRGGETREFSGDLQYTENSITINLNTPYNGFKKLHADASRTQAADGRIAADINLQRGNRKIGIAYDYLFEKSGGSGKVEISKRTTRPNGPLIELGLETNFPEFEKIEASIDVDRTPGSSKVNVDYKRGDRVAKFTGTLDKSETGGSVSFSASTPIAGFNDISLSGSYEAVPERSYALNIDYSRGQKYVHLTSSIKLDIHKDYGKLQSAGAQVNIKFDSMITRPVDLLVTFDGSMTAPPNGSANGKLVSTLNGKTVSVTYSVDRAEAGRRVSRITLTTPLKYPFKKIVYNGDVSLTSNKAAFSLEYGRKKVALDLSWFAGEAHQYGVEVRLNTPFKPVQSLELDVKGTVRPDESIDVMAHYRRGEKMVHVSGNLKRSGFDLDFETPTFGNFNLKASVIPGPQTYSVKALLTMQSGVSAGGEITVRAVSTRDMQLTVDVHTPVRGWERVTVDVAYSNTDESNILRVAFEAPQTKRVEVSFELTNWARNDSTFFKAGVTTNYLGNAFTFRTNILRDDAGMKYELEIESPFHILPSFKLTGTR